jgi:hypothetical protein
MMNTISAKRADEFRRVIYALHTARNQAEPKLTRAEIRKQLMGWISETAIARHMVFLRRGGWLPPG